MNEPASNSKPTNLYLYESSYQEIYQPTYDILFIFYDEDEQDDDDSWNDFVPPLPTSGGLIDG